MDLGAKIVIMLAAMGLLYASARIFGGAGEVAAPPVPQGPPEPEAPPAYDVAAEEQMVRPREAGAKKIQNYGFRTTDLRTGPPDPEDFFDELYVQFYDEATGHGWQASFTVCTPKGILRFMGEKQYESLLATAYIIVKRYDLDVILNTVLEPGDEEDIADTEPEHEPDQVPESRFTFRP